MRGSPPPSIAAATNSADAVAFLIDKSNFKVNEEIVHTNAAGNDCPEVNFSLLQFVIWQNRRSVQDVCKLLLDRGADIERVNEFGETPVFWAIRNSNAAALELLAAQGVLLDVVNNKGETPLSMLASYTEGTQNEMLLAVLKGLSVRAHGLVSVEDALAHSRQWRLNSWPSATDIARWKQSMKFDPFAKIRDLCGAGLHKKYDHKPTLDERIKELENAVCKHGAYLFDKKMSEVFRSNDLEAVKQLIATGIDLATFDVAHGATLLHWAAEHGHAEFLIDLLQNQGLKAVIDKETIHKYAALAEAKTVECAQILLNHGATVTQPYCLNCLIKIIQLFAT